MVKMDRGYLRVHADACVAAARKVRAVAVEKCILNERRFK